MPKLEKSFRVRIISADKVRLDIRAKSMTAANRDGVFDILPDHRPFITLISSGDIMIRTPDKDIEQVTLERGILKCIDNEVVILTNI